MNMVGPVSFAGLLPDEVDDGDSFLPSFQELRRKNLESLYGSGDDKSSKGSVDTAIRGLVDLINVHPSYVTLSSCSGRIAIFDPKECTNEEGNGDERAEGGKGQGEWIFVSHDPVHPDSIPRLFTNERYAGKLIFKHEPLLLHVGACSLERGRQFLSLALQLGFRESGLVVTPTRVTVAIRSHSLALTVPLAYSGALRPTDNYIVALVDEANQRMDANMKKLNRLEFAIKDQLFRESKTNASMEKVPQQTLARFQKLPALNLWGHDAVTVSSKEGGSSIYVFGGYGRGPNTNSSQINPKIARSNRIYSLRKHSNGAMSHNWREKKQMKLSPTQSDETAINWFGVDVSATTFAPTEGLRACLLPLKQFKSEDALPTPTIMIWGGRSSPSSPYGDILLYEPKTNGGYLCKPTDVRGDLPSPRWGHTLTPLSGENGLMAVLVGGRNEGGTSPDNVHVLKLIEDGAKRVFQWHNICTTIPPQFFHSVVQMSDDQILVVGGLSDPNNLLESFSDSYRTLGSLGNYRKRRSVVKPDPLSVFRVTSDDLIEVEVPNLESFVPHYGAGSCCLTSADGRQLLSSIGGLPLSRRKSQMLSSLAGAPEPMRWYDLGNSLATYEVHYDPGDFEQVDFGAMMHHCCVTLPDVPELAILGGGVSSFAFGPAFADSYLVRLELSEMSSQQDGRKRKSSIIAVLQELDAKLFDESMEGKEEQEDAKTHVLYVANQNAKALRTLLETENLLDKKYRMTKAEGALGLGSDVGHIAVPVKEEALRSLSLNEKRPWVQLVAASGKQHVPLSTAVMGSNKQRSR